MEHLSPNTFRSTVFVSPAGGVPAAIEVGSGTLVDRVSYLDLIGDSSYSDYGLRVVRVGGANSGSQILSRGGGTLLFNTPEAAPIDFQVGNVTQLGLTSNLTALKTATAFSGIATPAVITANQIDYSIAANATIIRLSSDAPRVISSLAGGSAGRYLFVTNIGAFPILLKAEDLTGTASNRFGFSGDRILFPDQGIALLYDATSLRWRSPNVEKQWDRTAAWYALGNSTAVGLLDAAALTVTGTATAANAVASAAGQYRRVEWLVTTAAANAIASFRAPAALWWRGNAAGLGGFNLNVRWGPATGGTNTSQRAFVGFNALTTAPTDVQPSSILNIIGMGWDAADANVQIMHNDAAGVATKIDLGAGFPVPAVDRGAIYGLQLLALPNSASVFYKVVSLLTGAVAFGSISTDLPANNIFLAPRGWVSVGGVSAVVGIVLSKLEIGSNY